MMSYIRFVWYRVQLSAGTETVHRWAANACHVDGRLTLEQYHQQQGMTLIAGPFKTRKAANEHNQIQP
jgi:hypothetical protein